MRGGSNTKGESGTAGCYFAPYGTWTLAWQEAQKIYRSLKQRIVDPFRVKNIIKWVSR